MTHTLDVSRDILAMGAVGRDTTQGAVLNLLGFTRQSFTSFLQHALILPISVVESGQIKRDAGEHPLPKNIDGIRLKVRHLDLEAFVESLRDAGQKFHSESLLAVRLNETLLRQGEYKSTSGIKKIQNFDLLTAWGIMTGTPGLGLLAMPGSMPRPVNSSPTCPVLTNMISAEAT